MNALFSDVPAKSNARRRGWVFYDADCAFCTSLVRGLEPTLLRRGFHCSPLQDRWVALALGISREELLKEMRVWTRKRELLRGADALVYLAGRIWWAWPLYALGRLPCLRGAIHAAYRSMAARRNCLSVACESTVQRFPVELVE